MSSQFIRHTIASYPRGYQVAVTDVNGDGRADVIALSTEANCVDWFENPAWRLHPVARVQRPIDLAPHDMDGDGVPEIALASGFNFSDSERGGEVQWLKKPANDGDLWTTHPITTDPVTHRLRWADLDGDGRKELVHAPMYSRGSNGPASPKPAHLWAFAIESKIENPKSKTKDSGGPLTNQPWIIDESLTVLHGIWAGDLDNDGRDELLTASFEGIHLFDWERAEKIENKSVPPTGIPFTGKWKKTFIASGAAAKDVKAGAPRGSSEVAVGRISGQLKLELPTCFVAAIEPWHGNQVVVYSRRTGSAGLTSPKTPAAKDAAGISAAGSWQRLVLDDTLQEGHALVVADFDGDGVDEIIAGWRGGTGGLVMFDLSDGPDKSDRPDGSASSERKWRRIPLDSGIAVEGAAAADLNRDGRLDLVAIAGRSNLLVWFENVGTKRTE
ncbi:MAG: VCBS repeat-containing protein [Candidatus Sumerlaeia bacterium]|nr:VCBS repeat-containing protein [Candidatus Sumerlaeia bacterium]